MSIHAEDGPYRGVAKAVGDDLGMLDAYDPLMDAWGIALITGATALGAAYLGAWIGGRQARTLSRDRWDREDRLRLQERSDRAGDEILMLTARAYELLRGQNNNEAPDQRTLFPIYEGLRRWAIELHDPVARQKVQHGALCLYHYDTAGRWTNPTNPSRVGYVVQEAVQGAVAAARRGEPIPETEEMERIYDDITDYWETMMEAERGGVNREFSGHPLEN